MAKAQSEILESIAVLRQLRDQIDSSSTAVRMMALQGGGGAAALVEGMASTDDVKMLGDVLEELGDAYLGLGCTVVSEVYTTLICGEDPEENGEEATSAPS